MLILKCNNGLVTDTYLELIGEAFSEKYGDVLYTNDVKRAIKSSKEELICAARIVDAFKLLMTGHKNLIMWFQGVEPEESYMVHKSKVRFYILSKLEKYIIRKSKFIFFVSDEMRNHYEKKYSIVINNYYCMPCMNTQIHAETFKAEGKYKNNTFAYIGSLAVWQKFEETVKAYKMIEDSGIPDCCLKVFTSQKEDAKKIIGDYKIKNYSIDFVDNDSLPKALEDIKYGFIIREDTTVNNVATPTKISTYLSCGLIPIYSGCLKDFFNIAQNMKYTVLYDDNLTNKIKKMDREEISYNDVYEEYKKIFETYYSAENHKRNIKKIISYHF